jgi:hypothetical protein
MENGVGNWLGKLAAMLIGGVIAAVTIIGLIGNAVDSPSDQPGNVNEATVPYGTTQ